MDALPPPPSGAALLTPLFQITEYEQVGYPPTLKFNYQSGPMRFRDASKYAAALSFALGGYVSVIAVNPKEEPRYEWWYGGALWRVGFEDSQWERGLALTEVPTRGVVEMREDVAEKRRRYASRTSRREQRQMSLISEEGISL
jgi:hypothetical protein